LKSAFCVPHRKITVAGEEPDAMYIIRFGHVEVRSRRGIRREFSVGDMFGEMAMVGMSPTGLRLRTSVALSVVELCKLETEDFMSLLQHPNLFTVVKNAVNTHLANMEIARLQTMGSEPKYSDSQNDAIDTERNSTKFYATVDFIDWDDVSKQMQLEKALQSSRLQLSSLFDDQHIAQIEMAAKQSMIKTIVVLQFHNLHYRQTNWTKAVVRCSWKGVPLPKMEATRSRGESELFWRQEITPSDPDDSEVGDTQIFEVPINRHAEIPLLHPASLSWDDLPPLEIRIVSHKPDLTSLQAQRSLQCVYSTPCKHETATVEKDISEQMNGYPANGIVSVSAQVGHFEVPRGANGIVSVSAPRSSSPIVDKSQKEGSVYKKGRINRGYQKRWFCLRNDVLRYFKERPGGGKVEKGSISCVGMSVETMEIQDGGEQMGLMYGFVISDPNGRCIECACEEEKDREEWIICLKWAAEQCLDSRPLTDVSTLWSGQVRVALF
jgi:hypothetical protein